MEALGDRIVLTPTGGVTVAMISNAAEGGADGIFRFTQPGVPTGPLTVNYTVAGTATSGSDYTPLTGTVTFAGTLSTTDLSVTAVDDVTYDPNETVSVTVAPGAGYTVDTPPSSATMTIIDNEKSPLYWVAPAPGLWNVPTNWSTGSVPTAADAIYFDSAHSNANCLSLGVGPSATQYAELHMIGGYSGTVTLTSNLSVGQLELTSGTLDQPLSVFGSDVSVTKAMLWTGGTINSTTHLSNLTISGGTAAATIAPAGGGAMYLGSNLNLLGGARARMLEGEINVTNDNTAINVNTGCHLEADPGDNQVCQTKSHGVTFGPQVNLLAGSWFDVLSGAYASTAPLKNSGGSFIVRSSAVASFGGQVDNVVNGPSFKQTAGASYLYAGSSLYNATGIGMVLAGGSLGVQWDTGSGAAVIYSNLSVTGGEIVTGANSNGDTHLFGELSVIGDINWSGGTFRPYVDGATAEGASDLWTTTGIFTIGGTAAIAPLAVDGENNLIPPPANSQWDMFTSDVKIVNAVGTPSISAGWAIDKDPNNPMKWWHLKAALPPS